MIQHWKTCLNLVVADLRHRADLARDSALFALCLLGAHRFPETEHTCTRCDARRVEFWGSWTVVDG